MNNYCNERLTVHGVLSLSDARENVFSTCSRLGSRVIRSEVAIQKDGEFTLRQQQRLLLWFQSSGTPNDGYDRNNLQSKNDCMYFRHSPRFLPFFLL